MKTKQRSKREQVILLLLAAVLFVGLLVGFCTPQEAVFTPEEQLAMDYVGQNLYALAFLILCLVCAAGLAALSQMMHTILPQKFRIQMRVLAALMADAGVWVLTESEILKITVKHVAVVQFISLFSFVLLIPLTLEFVARSLQKTPEWVAHVQQTALLFLTIDVIGWLAGLYMFWFLIPIHLTILVGIVRALRTTAAEYQKEKSADLRDILIGFGLLAVCVVLSMLTFYRDHERRTYALFYCVGMLLFLSALGGAVLRKFRQTVNDWMKAETYKTLAYRDALTGIGNFTAFKQEKARWNERNDWVCVMMDVNWLKQTNDRFGHAAGDALLCGASRCIQEAFFRADGCYRIGGDEFAVIWGGAGPEEVETAVHELRRLCRVWNETAEHPVSIAVGCAFQQPQDTCPDDLIARADAAMYADKADIKKKAQNQ